MATVKQFIVTLMNSLGMIEHRVNCANSASAAFIASAIYPGYRVIDVRRN